MSKADESSADANRDAQLLRLAEQYSRTARKARRLVRGRAYKVIERSTSDADMRDELVSEWDALAERLS